MQQVIEQIQSWVQVLGPNVYMQAAGVAAVFILVGKLADLLICRVIGRFVRQSSTDVDDRIIDQLHRPIFLTFVLVGLALATRRLGLPVSTTYLTLGVLRTIAILVWYRFSLQLLEILMAAARRRSSVKNLRASVLPLMNTVFSLATPRAGMVRWTAARIA